MSFDQRLQIFIFLVAYAGPIGLAAFALVLWGLIAAALLVVLLPLLAVEKLRELRERTRS